MNQLNCFVVLFQQHFFQVQPSAAHIEYGNITDRIELRKKLKCKKFEWYLKFIYPEQVIQL